MNKLDALIEACEVIEGLKSFNPNQTHDRVGTTRAIRRILEAVRKDMASAEKSCANHKSHAYCLTMHGLPRRCLDCPLHRHAATRAALEQLK